MYKKTKNIKEIRDKKMRIQLEKVDNYYKRLKKAQENGKDFSYILTMLYGLAIASTQAAQQTQISKDMYEKCKKNY